MQIEETDLSGTVSRYRRLAGAGFRLVAGQ